MSERTTAEIVADLNRIWHEDHDDLDVLLVAADRLAKLDAHERERLWLKGELQVIENALPDCPTCGGKPNAKREFRRETRDEQGRRVVTFDCPENDGNCDGKVSIERLVAVFNAVHDDVRPNAGDAFSYRYYLRSVR